MKSYVIEYASASNPYPNEDPARIDIPGNYFDEATVSGVVSSIADLLRDSFQVRVVTTTTTVDATPWETNGS